MATFHGQAISKNAIEFPNHERGAARHAKMLETDQAWDVFEKLEDGYFNRRQDNSTDCSVNLNPSAQPASPPHPATLHFEMPEPVVIVKDSAVSQLNALFGTVEYLETEMWPHLRALFPMLDKRYVSVFETSQLLRSLLKDVRQS